VRVEVERRPAGTFQVRGDQPFVASQTRTSVPSTGVVTWGSPPENRAPASISSAM
jgi:hypothetical protein